MEVDLLSRLVIQPTETGRVAEESCEKYTGQARVSIHQKAVPSKLFNNQVGGG
jgi:hypothetical protein